LIAEQIRRETFSYLGSPYVPPRCKQTYIDELPKSFLDCHVKLDDQARSLREVVSTYILKPLITEEKRRTIESGSALSKETPMSIIFFGPPGTSKTKLAEYIAERLGWPLLSIDASQFLKNGMDGVYAEADRIFGMLAVAERILVLLDEFDEMVRARESATDVLSRFLTTAMLPKLHKINDNRRLAFVVATNHIEAFDVAIKRPGRFDVILQVMPPIVREKLGKWKALANLTANGISANDLREKIKPLTFGETEILVRRLGTVTADEAKVKMLNTAHSKCILLSETSPRNEAESKKETDSKNKTDSKKTSPNTWEDICEEQSGISRVP